MWLRAVLVVGLFSLAGCGDRPTPASEPLTPGPPPMAAAWTVATDWNAQAEMGAVAGFEASGPVSIRPEGLEEAFFAPLFEHADPDVGDGNAAVWLFIFVAMDRPDARLEALLAADGAVLAQREEAQIVRLTALPRDLEPITPAITRFLDDLAAGWRADAGPNGISWLLNHNGQATWIVEGAIDAGGLPRVFAFDAYTATLLSPLGTASDPVQREMADGDGNLQMTPQFTIGEVELRASERLTLNDPHRELVAAFAPKDATTSPIRAVLVAPDGIEHPLEDGRIVVPWPQRGAWFLNLTSAGPGTSAYSYRLCAPGDTGDQACPELA